MNLFPLLMEKLLLELLQFTLWGADDVAPLFLPEQLKVLRTGHAAVHDPHTIGFTIERFHLFYDRFHGCRVVPIPFKHLIAKRNPLFGNDKTNADLFAIWATIPRISLLCLWVI